MTRHTYIIGEIGQNHNGSVDIAKLIVELVAREVSDELFSLTLPAIDAVKLTRRDLRQELSASEMNRPYNGAHAFGATYGAHREYLELSDEEHHDVYKHAKAFGLDFVETLCAIGCLNMLRLFTPDRLKVASRDLTNLPLLQALAETKIPIILSTGMAGTRELHEALAVVSRQHSDISILHCVSEYPTHPDHANLLTISFLAREFPQYTIGYSDHTIGISAPVAAVALGARVIEKHITIDRRMKGTDQAGSLGPDGVARMVRDIRLLDRSLGVEDLFIEPAVAAARAKLERSIASVRDLTAGHILSESDIHMLSPGSGMRWTDRAKIVGRTLRVSVPTNELLFEDQFE